MKKKTKAIALVLGTAMSLSLFASCGGSGNEDPYVASAKGATICYDNLSSGYISEADTQYKLELKKEVDQIVVTATDGEGKEVADTSTVAKFDKATNTLTAAGKGNVKLSLQNKKGEELSAVRVTVAPAYPEDPKNQYTVREGSPDINRDTSQYLGGCHDPSLIEVEENGKPAYYIFSTGWNQGNEIRRSEDMIHWEYKGKATKKDVAIYDIEDWIEEKNQASDGNFSGQGSIQWWAPDIVPAYGGGYWLYTCNVSNIRHNHPTDGTADQFAASTIDYSKACITLFYSKTLEPESFTYRGVLMQSCIPDGTSGAIDINSIDPQIIYTPDGKMYMAYGSFGTGNWMLELDPETGLRKDKIYKDKKFLDIKTVRKYRYEATDIYNNFNATTDVTHEYYGTMISKANMEAPVIARHDNVTISDENGKIADAKTYYYDMHSYNGLDQAYMMWGGRSESVTGKYLSVDGGHIYNEGVISTENSGNKYMGRFSWANKASTAIDIILPGHNDLFTMSSGTNIAAYITRTESFSSRVDFLSQTHQYYLNSFGDIVINPNRYGGEVNRSVTKDELLHYTRDNLFKMVVLSNDDNGRTSVDVKLNSDGKITYENAEIGTWLMYGEGYIKFTFTNTSTIPMLQASGETTFYGVVRPAWLDDQNKAGFTITCMGHTGGKRSMAMFLNNYSTL